MCAARRLAAALAGGRDDVGAREDVAGRRDDEAGALARRRRPRSCRRSTRRSSRRPAARAREDLGRLEAVAGDRLRHDHRRPGIAGRRPARARRPSGPCGARTRSPGRRAGPRAPPRTAARARGQRSGARAPCATIRRFGASGFLASDGRLRRFHVFRERQLGRQREREPASSRRAPTSSIRPSITLASSRAIARPSPLPEARAAVEPEEALEHLLPHLGGIPGPSSATVRSARWPSSEAASRTACRPACGRGRSRRGSGRSGGRVPRRRAPRPARRTRRRARARSPWRAG